jgi:hypothetical protein
MDQLEVGQKRVENISGNIFEIVAIGNDCVFCRYIKCHESSYCREFSQLKAILLETTKPYQEPKPVRKLKAFEHGNGTIVLRYCDKTNDLDYSSNYRKLSDSELKELIKGVIGE